MSAADTPSDHTTSSSSHDKASAQPVKTPWRKRLVQIAMLGLFIVFVMFGVYALKTPGLRPVLIYPYEGPILKPANASPSLGKIPTDSKVPYTFVLYNVGGKTLHISDVEASCGCTAVKLEKDDIRPGKYTALHVMLNTSLKRGKTVKTIDIYSNDEAHPVYRLTLTGIVEADTKKAHGKMKVKDPLVLFKGECATCHVQKGKGKSGEELFLADCSMCHGANAKGLTDVAPDLLSHRNYKEPATAEYIRKTIHEGSTNNPEMPPFHQKHGGPLNEAEIDSLVRYLAFKSSQSK